jgi:hypothetical protein
VEWASAAIAEVRQELAVVGRKRHLVIPLERGSFGLRLRGIYLETLAVSAEDLSLDFAQPGYGSFNSRNIEVFHVGEDSAFVPAAVKEALVARYPGQSVQWRFGRQVPVRSVVKEGPKPVGLFSEVPQTFENAAGQDTGDSTLWPVGLSNRS